MDWQFYKDVAPGILAAVLAWFALIAATNLMIR